MTTKKLYPILSLLIILLASCSSTQSIGKRHPLLNNQMFKLTTISTDATYGSESNPIKVGGVTSNEGPTNERRFLNALAGPDGEEISYHRKNSCCPFKTKNGFQNVGLLDHYEVTYEGLEKPISIYINMYDYGKLEAPMGFTIAE